MKMQDQRGFTLIELLVVIAIIGVLSTVVLASLISGRSKARFAAGRQSDGAIYRGIGALNLAGEWLLDEGSGSVTADTSGNGGNGTLIGSPVWVPGISGTALKFSGVADAYAQVPVSSYLKVGQPSMTITAWINPAADVTTTQEIAGRNSPYLLWVMATNRVRTGLYNGSSWVWVDSSTNTVRANEWQFVAMVYDGSTRRVYVNGNQVAVDNQVSGNLPDSNSPFNIGQDGTFGRTFNGSIDQVRLYSSALTARAIGEVYAAEAPRHGLAIR